MSVSSESTVERNKATVRRLLTRLSTGDIDTFVAALTPGYRRHCQAMPPAQQEIQGPDGMRAFLAANQATFPDWNERLEALVGEGDMVAWRSVGTGTQTGPLGPFPPTGKRMSVAIIGMHRFEGDRIAETWTSWDNVSALAQLGLLPPT